MILGSNRTRSSEKGLQTVVFDSSGISFKPRTESNSVPCDGCPGSCLCDSQTSRGEIPHNRTVKRMHTRISSPGQLLEGGGDDDIIVVDSGTRGTAMGSVVSPSDLISDASWEEFPFEFPDSVFLIQIIVGGDTSGSSCGGSHICEGDGIGSNDGCTAGYRSAPLQAEFSVHGISPACCPTTADYTLLAAEYSLLSLEDTPPSISHH